MNKYTLLDSSELLGVKVRTLREWIKLGKIKAEKIDRNGTFLVMKYLRR